MTPLIKTILEITGAVGAGILIMVLKNLIFKSAKTEILRIIPEEEKTKLLDLYSKGLVTLTHLKSLGITVEQKAETIITPYVNQPLSQKIGHDLHPIKFLTTFIRLLPFILIIIGCIYGYGYWKGTHGIQPVLDWHGKEEWVSLNEHYLHVNADGSMEILDFDKQTVLKKLAVKDFENLKKNSKPYGVDLRTFVTAGGSLGEAGGKFEAGIGEQWYRYYKWYLNSFITTAGFYPLGVSYKLTDNFDALVGAGIGWKGDKRFYIGGKWRF
jgi:hypothetical protein